MTMNEELKRMLKEETVVC